MMNFIVLLVSIISMYLIIYTLIKFDDKKIYGIEKFYLIRNYSNLRKVEKKIKCLINIIIFINILILILDIFYDINFKLFYDNNKTLIISCTIILVLIFLNYIFNVIIKFIIDKNDKEFLEGVALKETKKKQQLDEYYLLKIYKKLTEKEKKKMKIKYFKMIHIKEYFNLYSMEYSLLNVYIEYNKELKEYIKKNEEEILHLIFSKYKWNKVSKNLLLDFNKKFKTIVINVSLKSFHSILIEEIKGKNRFVYQYTKDMKIIFFTILNYDVNENIKLIENEQSKIVLDNKERFIYNEIIDKPEEIDFQQKEIEELFYEISEEGLTPLIGKRYNDILSQILHPIKIICGMYNINIGYKLMIYKNFINDLDEISGKLRGYIGEEQIKGILDIITFSLLEQDEFKCNAKKDLYFKTLANYIKINFDDDISLYINDLYTNKFFLFDEKGEKNSYFPEHFKLNFIEEYNEWINLGKSKY